MLARRNHARALAAIVFDWAVIVAAAAVSERVRLPGIYLVALVIIARQMNALFELHHHAIHCNLFRRKAWNTRLQFFYSLPLGFTVGAERDDHMEHHRTFNTVEKDYQSWGSGNGLNTGPRGDPR